MQQKSTDRILSAVGKIRPSVISLAGGFFLLGLTAWALRPVLDMEFLDILDPVVKYFVVAALFASGVYYWIKTYKRIKAGKPSIPSITLSAFGMMAIFYVALILGKNAVPLIYDYAFSSLTYDRYTGVVGKPAVISTKKFGTVTIFPVEREGYSEAVPLLPRDVLLPGIAVQVRSGDIATRLASTQGSEVCIYDIGMRRGKGPIYFLDFTQFPNPFMVTTDLSKCGRENKSEVQ